jgi:hypothetical protein
VTALLLDAPPTIVDLFDPLTDPRITPDPNIGSPIYDALKREWARRNERTETIQRRRQSRKRSWLRRTFMSLLGRHLPTPEEELDAKIAKFLREIT